MTSLCVKYQPQTLDAFVGMETPRRVLSAVAKSPYSSAFLLTGDPGTGKTTMALAFAKTINAEIHHIPSRMCDLETVERTVASCWYRPMFGMFHLVLVDEADQMTRPAQLAFLSKLDATAFPPDTVYVFTANETSKLEPRFLSRCRVLEFTTTGMEQCGRLLLERIWKQETKTPLPDCAVIMRKAGGNIRAALMALELKLLVANEPPTTRMKRILVKDSAGKWVHDFMEVSGMMFDDLDDYRVEHPPICGEADMEYQAKIEAARCTAEFRVVITPKVKQRQLDELPLFGGQGQRGLFDE